MLLAQNNQKADSLAPRASSWGVNASAYYFIEDYFPDSPQQKFITCTISKTFDNKHTLFISGSYPAGINAGYNFYPQGLNNRFNLFFAYNAFYTFGKKTFNSTYFSFTPFGFKTPPSRIVLNSLGCGFTVNTNCKFYIHQSLNFGISNDGRNYLELIPWLNVGVGYRFGLLPAFKKASRDTLKSSYWGVLLSNYGFLTAPAYVRNSAGTILSVSKTFNHLHTFSLGLSGNQPGVFLGYDYLPNGDLNRFNLMFIHNVFYFYYKEVFYYGKELHTVKYNQFATSIGSGFLLNISQKFHFNFSGSIGIAYEPAKGFDLIRYLKVGIGYRFIKRVVGKKMQKKQE